MENKQQTESSPPIKAGKVKANSDHVSKLREKQAKRVKASAEKTQQKKEARAKNPPKKRAPRKKKIEPYKEPLLEPSEEERANGWTAETLTNYIKSRQVPILTKVHKLTKTTNEYDPYRW